MNLFRQVLRRRLLSAQLFRSFLLISLCILTCELLIPFVYIAQCDWPTKSEDFSLKSIAFSDTHLFGLKRGHFLDKFKREWNMYIAFQLAIHTFQPNSIFFLGDIFDEGLIANPQEFAQYSSRFFQLFSSPANVKLTVSVGNHDVGFHDRMVYFDPYLRSRFENVFNSSLIEFKKLNGINVINVNSMAMEGDDCELCSLAEHQIESLSSKLFKKCKINSIRLCSEERPILMTHFPLFRKSDLDCNEPDSDYNISEKMNIRPRRSCLSKKSTNFLLRMLQPKLALNGHTHYGCTKQHSIKLKDKTNLLVDEYTLSSFNYRNRPNPGFILLLANANEFRISKCMLPNEMHLFVVYVLIILNAVFQLFRSRVNTIFRY